MTTSANEPPRGYRWATEEETERWTNNPDALPEAITVPLATDSAGRPYTEGEADLAVPTRSEP